MRHAVRLILCFWAVMAIPVQGSWAQAVLDQEVVLSYPILPQSGPGLPKIARVEPSGRLRVESSEKVSPRMGIISSEGWMLLLVHDESGKIERLARAKVLEIGDGFATAEVGPRVAAVLRPGQRVQFARPFQGLIEMKPGDSSVRFATTAQMSALPDVIEIEKPKAAGGGAAMPNPAQAAQLAASRSRSINNLKQIMLGMHNFQSSFNIFPPAVVYGPDGKPWHSWRVLLLPYLEENALYTKYDFSQPWDGPNNRKLIEKMPAVYRDPVYGDTKSTTTNYAVVVGERTLFPAQGFRMTEPGKLNFQPGPGVKGLRDNTDGTSNTIAVVSVGPERAIPWTKPEDLVVTGDAPAVGKPGQVAAPYTSADGKGKLAPVALADGSVRTIADSISAAVWKALLTRDGGEVVSFDAIPGGSPASSERFFKVPTLKLIRKDGSLRAVIE